MVGCVKCGWHKFAGTSECMQCGWPFTTAGWKNTEKYCIRRVTIDTNCINARGKKGELNTLDGWHRRGLITLQRSDRLLIELKGTARISKAITLPQHPRPFQIGLSAIGSLSGLGGPDLANKADLHGPLRAILFPNVKTLTTTQTNDVLHLQQHVRTGGDVFITLNTRDFIKRGKQTRLANIGIWVLTPVELVVLLKRLDAW